MLRLMVTTCSEVFLGFINARKRALMLRKERIVMMVHGIFRFPANRTLPMISIREVKRLINDWYHQLIHSFHNFASLDDASLFYSVRSKYFFINLLADKEFICQPGKKCSESMLGKFFDAQVICLNTAAVTFCAYLFCIKRY